MVQQVAGVLGLGLLVDVGAGGRIAGLVELRLDVRVRQVLARAERAAGAGDEHRPHRPVVRRLVERDAQLAQQAGRERVQRLRPVQRQDAHGALGADQQRTVFGSGGRGRGGGAHSACLLGRRWIQLLQLFLIGFYLPTGR